MSVGPNFTEEPKEQLWLLCFGPKAKSEPVEVERRRRGSQWSELLPVKGSETAGSRQIQLCWQKQTVVVSRPPNV